MGKVAKAFGVGVKGALDVQVARDAFDVGDVIEGFVTLCVTKRLDFKELTLTVEGTEHVSWWESHGQNSIKYHRHNDFLRNEIVLSHQGTFEPGEYSFGFSYQLPESLPSSVSLSGRSAGIMRKLSASTTYSLKAYLPVTTGFSADLQASRPILVYGRTLAPAMRLVSERASKTVRSGALFSRGTCEVEAQMDQDVCVAGDVLLVQTTVRNLSALDMSSISAKLYERLSVTVPSRKGREGSMAVCETKMSGVRAGGSESLVLSLPLVTKKELQPINPTTSTGTFVTWEYKLVVKCKFSMATGVEVEIPVVVLPPTRPRDEEVARVVVVAEDESDISADVLKPTV